MLLFFEIVETRRARRHLDAGPVGPIGTVSPPAGWRLRRQGQWVWLVFHTGSGRTRLGRRKQPRRCRLYEVPAHAHAKPHPFRTLRNELPIPPQGVATRFAAPSTFEGPGREIASAPRPLQWQIERLRARSGEWPLSSARGIVSQWCFRSGHKDAANGDESSLAERRSARRRGVARAWRRDGVQRRRRELPRSARRALRRAGDPSRDLPPGGRRGVYGGSLRQADRAARRTASDARPRRLQRLDRGAYRVPGFDADDRAGRPGSAPPDRPRGVSGG